MMNNVVKANFKKRHAVEMKCTACGAAGVAGCECGAPYMPSMKHTEEKLKTHPEFASLSDRRVAEKLGVNQSTVNRVRNRLGDAIASPAKRRGKDNKEYPAQQKSKQTAKPTQAEPVKAEAEPRMPPKLDMNIIKQAGAFHTELTKYTEEFCARVKQWHAANQIDEESHGCVVQALEMASMRLQRAAQDIDGR
ncbi:hypothetical protein P0R31_38780 [Bradyrhizobium yuanmingense]|uniref:hypothetical protein n=1 Tax=Bradyrhizobium yuanmingense TaxID=108015 RepID=UPI0023B9B4FA|nr:hypothetical protein [Bradyrhizobium yuanmingense]MDF0523165.1 hypothetical protein [Bradyrhizobium yuanmingense]